MTPDVQNPLQRKPRVQSGSTAGHSKEKKSAMLASVGIAFVSPAKHFPINIIPCLPSSEFPGGESNPLFKDKIQIAKELFDKSPETRDFSAVTFLSWYAATHFLEHIHT